MNYEQIHTDLYNALRLLRGDMPNVQNGWEAWQAVRPENGAAFVRGSFWDVLQKHLPFAKSEAAQKRLAVWITEQKRFQKTWPPIVLATRPAILPKPNILKPI